MKVIIIVDVILCKPSAFFIFQILSVTLSLFVQDHVYITVHSLYPYFQSIYKRKSNVEVDLLALQKTMKGQGKSLWHSLAFQCQKEKQRGVENSDDSACVLRVTCGPL